jgi:anti-sigma factor RsiW
MKCTRVQDRLVLYLARELSPREYGRITNHVTQCAACFALAEDLAATQERLETVLTAKIEAPASLDARVMRAVRDLPDHRAGRDRISSFWRRPMVYATSLCFVLLIALGVTVRGRYSSLSTLNMASLGLAHAILISSTPADQIQRSDPDQLASQLSSNVKFPVRVADLTAEGAQLVGGSRITVEGVPMVALDYHWAGNQISLFEMASSQQTPAALRQLGHESDTYYAHKSGDMVYVAWHAGKTECIMVARSVHMHELFRLACKACEKQETVVALSTPNT